MIYMIPLRIMDGFLELLHLECQRAFMVRLTSLVLLIMHSPRIGLVLVQLDSVVLLMFLWMQNTEHSDLSRVLVVQQKLLHMPKKQQICSRYKVLQTQHLFSNTTEKELYSEFLALQKQLDSIQLILQLTLELQELQEIQLSDIHMLVVELYSTS